MARSKRFKNRGNDIWQYGEWWCSAGGEHCADVIATALNELLEKNDELKSTLPYRSNQLALIDYLINDLGSEEMLRQYMEIMQ